MIIRDKDGNDVTYRFFEDLNRDPYEGVMINKDNYKLIFVQRPTPTIEYLIEHTDPDFLFFCCLEIKLFMICKCKYSFDDINRLYEHFNIKKGTILYK